MSMTTTKTASSATPTAVYLYAGDQIIENVTTGNFYFQDSLGNTSHVTDAMGNLLERYTYSAFGTPTFYNAAGTQIVASAYGIRHLFQGQLWTQETGLNDYRNRVELPTMGVFLQPDPIGFKGDAANIYRFCGNDPVDRTDPTGLDQDIPQPVSHMLTSFGKGDWVDASGLSVREKELLRPAGMDGGGLVRWSDEGNRNQHEPVVKGKDGKSYNALTEPELKVTAADGVITVHYIINVRYSDNIGPHNKERQKLEPDHGNEIDNEFRHNRGPKAIERLTRPAGPLEGKSLETQRSMIEHVLRIPFESAVEAIHERHDNVNPLKGPIGDHVIIHPDGLNY